MLTLSRSHSLLSFLLACALCLLPFTIAHSQDEPPAKPPIPAPRVWKEYQTWVKIASVSPDGKQVAVVAGLRKMYNPYCIFVYDRETGKERYHFPSYNGRSGGAGSVTFTPDGKRIVSVTETYEDGRTEDLNARVTDAATGKQDRLIRLRRGQYMYIHTLYVVSDKVLIVAGTKEVATVYDLATGKELGNLPGSQRVDNLSLSRDGRWLVGLAERSQIHAWDVEKRAYLGKIHQSGGSIQSVAISPDGASVAFFAAGYPHIHVLDRVSREEKAKCEFVLAGGRLRFTVDGKTLVAGGMGPNHGLVVWDWKTSKEMRGGYPTGAKKFVHMLHQRGEEGRKAWHFGYLSDFSMSDDGKTIAYVTAAGKVNLWELISPEPPPKK